MFKRIGLFLLTNLLILVTISIIFTLFGIRGYIENDGINFVSLLIFSGIIGFTGSIISLLISRWMAKRMMGVKVIDPDGPGDETARWLVREVHALAKKAGMKKMPEVGIYPSSEINAFATGPSKNKSLVAVSAGLLSNMDQSAIKGVLAHEIAHITNGDMVTMTLLQGIINTFVEFLSRICAYAVSRFVNESLAGIVHFLAVVLFNIVFSILGSLVVFAYSRRREYFADKGGAALAGKENMIHALRSLQRTVHHVDRKHTSLASMKISGGEKVSSLFSTHPKLEDRINALEKHSR